MDEWVELLTELVLQDAMVALREDGAVVIMFEPIMITMRHEPRTVVEFAELLGVLTRAGFIWPPENRLQ